MIGDPSGKSEERVLLGIEVIRHNQECIKAQLSKFLDFDSGKNIGMVSGIMPVVGVPLPLISYGGTSMVTLMAGFGILMSIQTHRKLIAS